MKRLQERNKLSIEEAQKRINSQPSNKEYVSHANIIFCSYWDPIFTKTQVQKAWFDLKQRLSLRG